MKRLAEQFAQHIPMLLITAVMIAPLVVMVGTSLKSASQMATEPTSFVPREFAWGNYAEATSVLPFWRCLANTLILCIGSVIGTLVSCSLAAYAFARLEWPGRDVVFGLVIATLLLPWQVTMIPKFLLIKELGLYNSLAALVVPTFFGDAFYIFLLRQFFRSVPRELTEAARIDGCSEFAIFWRVVLPLAKPALATVALFQFIAAWNDYGGPLLYLADPEKFPLAYGLEQFVSSHSSEQHLMMAAAVLFTLPIVALFFFTQRTFLRGIATTGLKG